MSTISQQPGTLGIWHTGEWNDLNGSVQSTEAPLTGPQEVVAIGNRIPVVFGKQVNGAGGVWVTPPAARYGVKADQAANTVGAAVGLVVSDGKIGAIATADVYRGATAVSALAGGKSVFKYGSMPSLSDGFDFTVSGSTVENLQDILAVPISKTYAWTASGCTTVAFVNFLMRANGTTARSFRWKMYADGVLKGSSSGNYITSFSHNATFPTPTTVRLELELFTGDSFHPPGATVYGTINYNGRKATTAGNSPISGAPISPGEGGTFEGLSCLAVRGDYLYSGSNQDPTVTSTTDWKSATFNSTYTLTLPTTRSVKMTNMRMQTATGTSANFSYVITVDGTVVQSQPGTAGASYPATLTYERSFLKPVEVKVVFTRYDNSAYTKPFTLLADLLEYTSEIVVDKTQPMTFTDAVRCFVRNGIEVENLLTGAVASTDNFADVALYLLRTCGKVPDALIDMDGMRAAARFVAAQGFTFNGVVAGASNLRSYLQAVAPFFLLEFAQVDGRFTLLPLLPTTADGQLSTAPLSAALTFDERTILAGSYSRQYIPASERVDAIALLTWRSQAKSSYALNMIEEVRYASTPADALRLQLDASGFCTSASHAAMIGRHVLACRKLIGHRASFSTTVEHAGALKPRDVVTARLPGILDAVEHYRVLALSDAGDGLLSIEAEQFPVDGTGAPLVTLEMLRTD
jgi:hypothetical protein